MYFISFSNSVKAEIVFVKYLQYCTFSAAAAAVLVVLWGCGVWNESPPESGFRPEVGAFFMSIGYDMI